MGFVNASKLILTVSLISCVSWAQVDVTQTKKLVLPVDNYDSEMAAFSNEIAPAVKAEDTSDSVVAKIVDNSLSYWFNKSGFKDTSMGKAATQIEKKMRADVDLGSDSNNVEHKLSLKLLASQALAKLEYTGWFKGAFNYDAKSAKAEAEVLENISNNKDLVVSHSVTSAESKSHVSLRWNW